MSEALVAILLLRGSTGVAVYREPGCPGALTDLHQGSREASQSRPLREACISPGPAEGRG